MHFLPCMDLPSLAVFPSGHAALSFQSPADPQHLGVLPIAAHRPVGAEAAYRGGALLRLQVGLCE